MAQLIVGLSKRKGWFQPSSWAIMLVGRKPFSHAYVRFYSKSYDRDLVYQASGSAVNFMEYNRFLSEEDVYAEFAVEVSEEAIIQTIQYAIDHVGQPYGLLQATGLGIYLICRAVGIRLKGNPFASKAKTVCSELVEGILNDFADQNIAIDPDIVMPGDIYDAMLNNPAVIRIK